MECTICYNNILNTNKVVTECNHVFHFSCLLKNFKSNPSTGEQCPLCRKSFLQSYPINNSNTYIPPSNLFYKYFVKDFYNLLLLHRLEMKLLEIFKEEEKEFELE